MSFSDYHYASRGTDYEFAYGKSFDINKESREDLGGQCSSGVVEQYGYTQAVEQYCPPSGYDYPDCNSTAATALAQSTEDYNSYSYFQDSTQRGQQTSPQELFGTSAAHHISASSYSSSSCVPQIPTQQAISEYNSTEYQQTNCNPQSNAFRAETLGCPMPHHLGGGGGTVQEEFDHQTNTWSKNYPYNNFSYDGGHFEGSDGHTNYFLSEPFSKGNNNPEYNSAVQSHVGMKIPQVGESCPPGTIGYGSLCEYDTVGHAASEHLEYGSYSGSGDGGEFFRDENGQNGIDSVMHNHQINEQRSDTLRSNFKGGYRRSFQEFKNIGSTNQPLNVESGSYPNQSDWSRHSNRRSSFSHQIQETGSAGGISNQRPFVPDKYGNSSRLFSKRQISATDARNKINKARYSSTDPCKTAGDFMTGNKRKSDTSFFNPKSDIKSFTPNRLVKTVEPFKTPSRPQDRLLNEIKEKEMAQKSAESKESPEEYKSSEEMGKNNAKEDGKKAEEELRQILAEEAVKAAPPNKPPETPEEIAHEEEIQRKIRESVVIVKPECELALMKTDPSIDLEMPDELRNLLKTLATDYLCKLCSVRIIGPHMATMHYNGKNHLKKLRNFVQTNGRSAGFNMENFKEPNTTKDGENESTGEKGTEIVEIVDVDENKYCKVCKVSFSQDMQAAMHYKGKNHAKKMKSVGLANGPEVFECKICCVTVTAQEHLTAHLNGARHKLQIRKLDTNENYRGRNRGMGQRGSWEKRGGRNRHGENVSSGEWSMAHGTQKSGTGSRGRGNFQGRDHFQEHQIVRTRPTGIQTRSYIFLDSASLQTRFTPFKGFKRQGGDRDEGSHHDVFASFAYPKRPRML